MPKKCENCSFFHPDNDLTHCPDCGQELKFTMLTPPNYQREVIEVSHRAEAWKQDSAKHEQLELPGNVRLTQIVAGIVIYSLISRSVKNFFLAICFVGAPPIQFERFMIAYLLLSLIFYVVGALAGGAVAGAWSVNWVPQGIGVGIGVFVLPFIFYVLFGPANGDDMLVFLLLIVITTALSILGAWIGHKIVRPSRYVIS
jgi:hypothetical protein